MKSLKELYRIGKGPSSSHTMGPNKAAKMFAERHFGAASFEVTLYGSTVHSSVWLPSESKDLKHIPLGWKGRNTSGFQTIRTGAMRSNTSMIATSVM